MKMRHVAVLFALLLVPFVAISDAAISQTSSVRLSINSTLLDTLDLSTVKDEVVRRYAVELATGTGNNQANQVWHDQRTVATGATDSIDLAGVLTNAIRQTVTFSAIKFVVVKAAAANTTVISVTRPASGVPLFTAEADSMPVGPNGLFVWSSPVAGVAVTAGTGDLLDIVNAAGASAVYDILIVGVQ